MSNVQQNFNAGQSHGQAKAKTEDWIGSTKDSAQSAQQSAQETKQEAAGILQQTGEQVKNMAQGAVDTVKNTLGMGDQRN
ncbi:late embryogenesis abundant protein D-7 [Ziziphus jujuba]|uniref:Late embryogenesis abundant protein D-7 n=2 Tax=Ziziphus jujuba TaxID=326968 RepID=A0A6P4A376_ZIZJJ|nr:late embryogenesis abundant protein D-7 [Ziziphus jujuba]KAH7521889.1 hypothetical protein FEM48_Zijuj07G0079800 [Ziziphus jujuba var. spinosa]